ncbi:LamG-like jellyroll fold domain-containing protein [Saccharopolyspora shandongensis]|uniref:LamG-like jellyroll fold domain-containing protein n=1 Tax=Saccharopolyspora shandongensis TaxID=418495 RepID=UPI00342080B5
MLRYLQRRAVLCAYRVVSVLLVLAVTAGLLTVPPQLAFAAGGEIPEQDQGSAAGLPHSVPAEATSPGGDSGGAPHNAPPATGLAPDTRHPVSGLPQREVERTEVEVGVAPPAEPEGFDPTTSRELVERRSSHRQVFDNADGTETVRVYQSRRFTQQDDGSWAPVDSSLVSAGDVWRTRSDAENKQFAAVSDAGQVATMKLDDGASFSYGVVGAESVRGVVEGDQITYPEIRPGADLQLQAVPAGVKETLVLKSPDSPTSWDYPLSLGNLRAELDGGSVVLKAPDGVVKYVLPPGFMEDSKVDPGSGEGARSTAVRYELVGDATGPVLRVSVDEEWLASPERVFPVKVDPSVVGKGTNGSTYVLSPYSADYSGDPNLSVGTYNGGGNRAAAYLKFDSVGAELAGHYILGAKLWMYETWSYSCEPRDVYVNPVTQPWAVGGNKTFPGPGFGPEIARRSFAFGFDGGGCGSRWVDIDLGNAGRDLVHGWTHGAPNHGLTVRASETDTKGWKKFASAASANPPYLEITHSPCWANYQVGGMSPVVTTTKDGVMQVTVTNLGRDTWTPTNNYKLGYRLFGANGVELPADRTAWTAMPHNVAPGQTALVNATVKSLPPGDYTLHWDMDHFGTTRFSWQDVPWSAPVRFTIPNQKPVVESMSPPSNHNSGVLTPTLALSGRDPDNWPGRGIDYNFKVCEADGSNCFTSGFVESPVWPVPEGKLRWGKTYVWYGQIGDFNTASPWTQGAYLSTQVPQPAITSHLSGTDGAVDPGVGNYATKVVDASISAVGPPLAVERSYNSLDPRSGLAFGTGWSTRWDSRIVPDGDGTGNVVVTYPDGRTARFGKNPDGTYAAPAGHPATLIGGPGTGWMLRTSGGDRHDFDAVGRLTTITDSSGHVQTISYRADGTLEKVADVTSARSLTFTWLDGHVSEVSVGALTWFYRYVGDQLNLVCDPTGACLGYKYTAASHYRPVVLDANPQAYWRLADAPGNAAVSEAPGYWSSHEATSVNVQPGRPGPIAGSSTTAAGFDGSTSYVQLPDDLVRNSKYIAVELWFQTTSTNGGVLFSTGYDRPGADPASGGAMPVLYVGTDGKLHGHFWNESVTGITSASPVNDGAWHHVVLSAARDSQTLYLDGVPVGTQAGAMNNIDPYNHVGAGRVDTREWPARPVDNWGHFNGAIAEVAIYHQAIGATVVAEHYASRAATQQLTQITRPGGKIAADLAYDPATARVTSHTDGDGGTYAVGAPATEGDGFRYGTAVAGSAPDAHWRLTEKSGTAADGQAWLRRAEYHRGTGGQTPGPLAAGSARSFDGTASYVRLPDNAVNGNRQLSAELWFKTSSNTGGVLLSTGNDLPSEPAPWGGAMPVLYVGTDGKLYGHFWNGNTAGIASPNPVNDGTWHHVVLAGADSHQTMYLDGVAVGSQSGEIENLDPHAFVGLGLVATLTWPARPQHDWGYFTGAIGQVALYPRAITSSEAQQHYAARGNRDSYATAVRSTGPKALWGLEEPNNATHAESDPSLVVGSYHDVTLAAEPPMRGSGAATFNGTSSYLRLPDRQAHGRSRLSVELWFNTSSTDGGVLYATGNDLPGSGPSGGAMPVLYVGTDGKLYGHFWNGNTAGIVTPGVVNDGEWHHAVLTADGDEQRLHLDGNLVGSVSGQVINIDRYDLVGAGLVSTSDWPAKPADSWGYFNGAIGDVAIYHRALDTAGISDHYSAKVAATAVRTTNPTGGVTTYTYDPTRGGRLVSASDPAGATRLYGYDVGGFVNRVTDENGHVTTFSNDARGNELSRTVCATPGTEACYTSYQSYFLNQDDPLDPRNDRVIQARDGRSASAADNKYLTTYDYTPSGQLSAESVPGATTGAQRTTNHTYTAGTEPAANGGTQPPGLLASATDPAGGVSTYTYTSAGDLAELVDPAGLTTRYGYDELGRKSSETVVSKMTPDGVSTTYGYDKASRLTEVVEPVVVDAVSGGQHQRRTTHAYNADGTVKETTVDDAIGTDGTRTTAYTYDNRGRVDTVTDPERGVTRTEYDTFGEVSRLINPVGSVFTYAYTETRHQLATITVAGFTGDGGQPRDVVLESRAYDPAGRLASITDTMGRTRAFTYYDDNLLASERLLGYTDPDSTEARDLLLHSYEYLGNGAESVRTSGDGRYRTTTSYDPGGRPVTTTDHDGGKVLRSSETTFDPLDNPIRMIQRNADGSVASDVEAAYDPMGRQKSSTTHTGTEALVTTADLDERGLPLSVVDPRGTAGGGDPAAFTTHFGYDALGRATTVTEPPVEAEANGGPAALVRPVITTGYNTFDEVVAERDPNGNTTRNGYDKAGRQTSVTMPDYTPPGASAPITATVRTAYDAAGRVKSRTDAFENVTTFEYDQLDNLVRRTDPPLPGTATGGTWTATFDPLGEQLSATAPIGAQTHATYDKLGRQITATVVEREPGPTRNLTTRSTYDALGNPATSTTPTGLTTRFTHDDLGNLLSIVDAAGLTTAAGYDGAGRLTAITRSSGVTTTYGYDLAGRLVAASDLDAAGKTVRTRSFGYDQAGNQTSSTDAYQATTTMAFDALNQLRSITRPVSGNERITTGYGYDAAGNITRATDGNRNATAFTVNPWGLAESTIEPATAQTPNPADRTYTAAYDAMGRIATLTKPGGVTITHSYDALGNLVRQAGAGTAASTPDRMFDYDALGRMTTASAPGGVNTFGYDDRNNLISASGPSGDSSFAFDDEGRLTTATTAAGKVTYGYDPVGRLASAVDPLSGTSAYSYDTAGRTARVDFGTGGASRELGYDMLSRLSADTFRGPDGAVTGAQRYVYDLEDRLVRSEAEAPVGLSASSYGYDQAGRLSWWDNGTTTTGYGWDLAGNLVDIGGETAVFNERNQLLSRGGIDYTYTPRGTLASHSASGVSTDVVFNAFDELVSDGTNIYAYDALNRLVSADGGRVAYAGRSLDVTAEGGSLYSYLPGGEPLGVTTAGTPGVAVANQHTDLVGVVDPTTGGLSGWRTFTPLGSQIEAQGVQPGLGFQRQYTDPDTGRVNMGSRWYQPGTGTFASRDQAGLDPRDVGNANRFAYAGSSPLNHTDPTGQLAGVLVGAAVIGIALVVGYGVVHGQQTGALSTPSTPNLSSSGIRAGAGYALNRSLLPWRVLVNSLTRFSGGRGGYPAPRYLPGQPRYYSPNLSRFLKYNTGSSGKAGRGKVSGGVRAGSRWVSGGSAAARAAALAAAEAARQAARAQRVRMDALTPHARPPLTQTIAPNIQAQIDAARTTTPIELGVLDSAEDPPFTAEKMADPAGPAPLPPINASLDNACATGGKATGGDARSFQIWQCGDSADAVVGRDDAPQKSSSPEDLVRVGRWMSSDEYQKMVATRTVQGGQGGRTYVANPADVHSFMKQAAPGALYVEFDVPVASLSPGGKQGWAYISGPDDMLAQKLAKLGKRPAPVFPKALNIGWVASKVR